ncbi:MAG TPA: type II secretion system F family protein [Candidatus Limnocylindria bacterium]|jgi:tight adherence protein B|nr:type II secretion system F family protein [Candidatus Limnocylindria bacterium]
MAAVTPFAIIFGGIATIALLFASFWEPISKWAEGLAPQFAADLDVAGMKIEPGQYAIVLMAVGAAVWLVCLVLLHPTIVIGSLLLVALIPFTFYAGRWWVKRRRAARVAQFQDQLEGALRTLAGGVRVGLGIRQAIILVGEQSRDPVRHEFMRVVGLTNIGVSILDAFDQLALRMTNPETGMLTRVIRVQSQTGGDLASVLENLAGTIRDRRRLRRRIRAITAQGRATGWLLGLLPIGVGLFVVTTQPSLRDAMLFTPIGRILLGVALALDGLAIYSLMKIVKVDP